MPGGGNDCIKKKWYKPEKRNKGIFCSSSWEMFNKLGKSCSMTLYEWKINVGATKVNAQIVNYTSNNESFYMWMQSNVVMKSTQEENSKC